jgi:tRNA (cytidine/uridine-2'-O-)-methyltransferase
MDDRLLRRAGLDYHETRLRARHASWAQCLQPPSNPIRRAASPSRHAAPAWAPQVRWQAGDWLVFGSESAACRVRLARLLRPDQRVRLPMRAGQRSLNLSNAVAVAVFEAWRQNGFAGAADQASGGASGAPSARHRRDAAAAGPQHVDHRLGDRHVHAQLCGRASTGRAV